MGHLKIALEAYERETRALCAVAGVTEETFYPPIKQLLSAALEYAGLPFDIRTGTSELRPGGGRDRPDFVIADGNLIAGYGEVKPSGELEALSSSTDRDDQIGRYLARTGLVFISNTREIGVVLCSPGFDRGSVDRVPPNKRHLAATCPLWRGTEGELSRLLNHALLDCAPIGEPATLARVLALQARAAKADLPADLRGLDTLLEDYRDALGLSFNLDDDEGREFFRSTLIQTAFYGLFAAWALWQRDSDGQTFSWDRINRYLRIPFLAGLFHEFRNPTRLRALNLEQHLDRATDTLNRVDLDVFRQKMTFPSLNDGDVASAAMTYFYEPFLEAFDPDLKKAMGVWYTPPEVVRYQVRKAHALLKEQLGRPLGLADERVVLLDPCCGTGAYLLEAARCIADELVSRGEEATVGLHLLQALTSRIFGFEVLTAPFAIAQLQLYVLLSDLRAPPPNNQRLGVFLTNALTGWHDRRQLRLNFPELQLEFDAAQGVKHDADIVVVLGNPPYDRSASVGIEEEHGLIDHYKGVTYVEKRRRDGSTTMVPDKTTLLFRHWGVRKQLLNDLYVRFYRLAEREIGEEREYGLVSLITNSSWLTGRSHPIMRESLLTNFHEAWIDNLNGDKYRTGKIIPRGIPGEGTADQSVFSTESDARGIQTGVAIATFLKRGPGAGSAEKAIVNYRDFWGRAALKRRQLSGTEPAPAYDRIRPTAQNRWRLAPHTAVGGYDAWPSLEDLFPHRVQGVNPNRGLQNSVVDTQRDALSSRMQRYASAPDFETAKALCPELAAPRANYKPGQVWADLRTIGVSDVRLRPYLLFPFDQRWIYYEDRTPLLNRARQGVGGPDMEFLIAVPEPRKVSEAKPLFARTLLDLHVHDRGSVMIPAVSSAGSLGEHLVANISPSHWRIIAQAWSLEDRLDGPAAFQAARNLIRICLAVMHAPAFGSEHASALAADWAHIPMPADPEIARRLVALGSQVADLLDCTSDTSRAVRDLLGDTEIRQMAVWRRRDGRPIAESDMRVTYSYFGAAQGRFMLTSETHGDLWINEDVCLSAVPKSVWQRELGGYQVIRKWLGYRHVSRNENRPLNLEDQRWLRAIVHRIAGLDAIEPLLDEAYESAAGSALVFPTESQFLAAE